MARMATIIMVLAAVAVTLVHLRREQACTRYEIQRCLNSQIHLRRKLWDQKVRIGQLLAPDEVRRRARRMALNLTNENEARLRVARTAGNGQ